MFMVKKAVALLLFPLSLCLGALLAGTFLLWFTRRQRTGKILVSVGVALLVLFSYYPFANLSLRYLESRYPPLIDVSQLSDIRWVAVLGGGHHSAPLLPATAQLSAPSLGRLVEGIRIHTMLPGSRLLLSGGSAGDPVPEATTMGRVAEIMGIEGTMIILEERSRDTADQARFIHEIVGDERFILVTSASHMPRSMALFRKLGMDPIPAPADYCVKENQGGIAPGAFFPSAASLRNAERALYEYLGFGWAMLSGQV